MILYDCEFSNEEFPSQGTERAMRANGQRCLALNFHFPTLIEQQCEKKGETSLCRKDARFTKGAEGTMGRPTPNARVSYIFCFPVEHLVNVDKICRRTWICLRCKSSSRFLLHLRASEWTALDAPRIVITRVLEKKRGQDCQIVEAVRKEAGNWVKSELAWTLTFSDSWKLDLR